MDLTYITLELVCVSLGAGSAFILDSFFILSHRGHKIRQFEFKLLRRLSLLSITSSFGAIIFYLITLSNQFLTSTDMRISIFTSKIIILCVTLLAGIAIRKIHLKALMRHQEKYSHLSESMMLHPDPLVSTAAYSSLSWMFVIFLTALEYKQGATSFHFGFVSIILSYIVLGILASKVAIFVKRRMS